MICSSGPPPLPQFVGTPVMTSATTRKRSKERQKGQGNYVITARKINKKKRAGYHELTVLLTKEEGIDGTLQKSTAHLLLPNLDSTVQRWSERSTGRTKVAVTY